MPDKSPTRGQGLPPSIHEENISDGRSYLFGIGISEYQNLRVLPNAVKDLEDFYTLLTSKYDIDTAVLLRDKQASRDNIIQTFEELFIKIQPEDRLLIYYSGHGILQGERGFWQPYDARKDKPSTYFSYANLKEYIRDIKARHILVIADSCYSGQLIFRGEDEPAKSFNRPFYEMNRHKSRWLLASGREYEKVADGTPGKNSPFADALLNYLRSNQADFLNISRLGQDVIGQVANNYRQHPTSNSFSNLGHHPHGEYVFRKKGANLLPPKGVDESPSLVKDITDKTTPKSIYNKWAIGSIGLLVFVFITFQLIQNANTPPIIENLNTENLTSEDTLLNSKKAEPEVPSTSPPQEETEKRPASTSERPKNQANRLPKSPSFENDSKGNTYQILSFGSLLWTKENLSFETALNSSCYDFESSNCDKYGRLYTYETAQIACKSLGNGWRLPTLGEFKQHFNDLKGQTAVPLGGMINTSNESQQIDKNGFYWLDDGVRIKMNQRGILDNIDFAPKDDFYSCKCVKQNR